MLVVGDDDVRDGTVGVNPRGGEVGSAACRWTSSSRGSQADAISHLRPPTVVTLDRLWAEWRSTYVSAIAPGPPIGGSVFSRILAERRARRADRRAVAR